VRRRLIRLFPRVARLAPAAMPSAAMPSSDPAWRPRKEHSLAHEPDEPLLTNLLRDGAQFVAHGLTHAVASVAHEAAALRAREEASREAHAAARPPWRTLAEQLSILEPALRERCLRISLSPAHFTRELAARPAAARDVVPGCLPTAHAALEEDEALRALRFELVPSRLSEEEFWRCYFWRVALIKCELCHDWSEANRLRRQAKLEVDEAQTADALLLAAQQGEEEGTASGEGPSEAELDAEFDRLVMDGVN